MAKPTPQQLEDELKKQQQTYGDFDDLEDEDQIGKDTEEDLERVIGNEPDPEEDGFSIAEEVEEDEEAIEEGSDNQEEITSLEDLDDPDL